MVLDTGDGHVAGHGCQYDSAKNAANKKKHKVSLADAEAVFYDGMALEREDNDHEETRWVIMGRDATGRVLVVAYTYREPDFVRLISARVASKNELHQYLGG
ncbi:BrnT family toxin [Pseudomonas marvdashtae]|uniref:BrnT family toxin n=1 Tax=Pseudomonas marvdashtae TaxID=2745500 RepID=UPI00346294C9